MNVYAHVLYTYIHTVTNMHALPLLLMLGWANHFPISTIVMKAPQILYFEI